MPRPLRPIAARLVYHVVNRGNNRARIFADDDDYVAFLQALADLKSKRPFALYGYCLMPDHVHLLLRPREAPISRIMQSLLVSHTHRYHRRHESMGHVWQGRFKSPVVQDDEHVLSVLRYIEANPVRARIVKHSEDYRWSSFPAHGLGLPNELLDPLPLYEALAATPSARRRKWISLVQRPLDPSEIEAIRRSVQSSRPLGDAKWVDRLANRLGLDLTIRPRGRPRKYPLPAPAPEPTIKSPKSAGRPSRQKSGTR